MGIMKNNKVYESFKLDEYVFAVPTALFIADLPSDKYGTTDDPKPSVKFLFSNGEVRKWTRWLTIAYTKKSNLPKLFGGLDNADKIIQTADDPNSIFWTTPMKILVQTARAPYTSIERVKSVNDDELAQLTEQAKSVVYDKEFTPYRFVKAYGKVVPLKQAIIKTDAGVKILSPDDFIDPPPSDN